MIEDIDLNGLTNFCDKFEYKSFRLYKMFIIEKKTKTKKQRTKKKQKKKAK